MGPLGVHSRPEGTIRASALGDDLARAGHGGTTSSPPSNPAHRTLRYQLAFDAGLCTDFLAVFLRVIFGWLKNTAKKQGIRDAQGAAITVVQRFGSALNLNLHLHSLVLDGLYTRPTAEAVPVFHPLPAPTDDEVGAKPTLAPSDGGRPVHEPPSPRHKMPHSDAGRPTNPQEPAATAHMSSFLAGQANRPQLSRILARTIRERTHERPRGLQRALG